MKNHVFRKGDLVDLYDHELEILGYHDGVFDVLDRQLGDIGEFKDGERATYTKQDVQDALKRIDGENHEVRYET